MDSEENVKQAVPFFSVADIEKSVHYYVDGLGFAITRKWVVEGRLRWCWLQLGGAAIMLQEFLREGHDSWSPKGKLGEGVSIEFQCNDALTIYRTLTQRGIPATLPQVGNGLWVTTLTDPDGYRLEFESPTDQPEDTVYTEQA